MKYFVYICLISSIYMQNILLLARKVDDVLLYILFSKHKSAKLFALLCFEKETIVRIVPKFKNICQNYSLILIIHNI